MEKAAAATATAEPSSSLPPPTTVPVPTPTGTPVEATAETSGSGAMEEGECGPSTSDEATSSVQSDHCYGLPYQDHNYGGPPGLTPPHHVSAGRPPYPFKVAPLPASISILHSSWHR